MYSKDMTVQSFYKGMYSKTMVMSICYKAEKGNMMVGFNMNLVLDVCKLAFSYKISVNSRWR